MDGYLRHGPGNGEDDGQSHEAVVEAEDADEEEDLEEWEADVGLGGGEQDECQQGGQAPVQHRRPNLRQGQRHALVPAQIFFPNIFQKIVYILLI